MRRGTALTHTVRESSSQRLLLMRWIAFMSGNIEPWGRVSQRRRRKETELFARRDQHCCSAASKLCGSMIPSDKCGRTESRCVCDGVGSTESFSRTPRSQSGMVRLMVGGELLGGHWPPSGYCAAARLAFALHNADSACHLDPIGIRCYRNRCGQQASSLGRAQAGFAGYCPLSTFFV